MRKILEQEGIARLDAVYCRAYALNAQWRAEEPLARYLHRPKLPEALSISIAAMVARDLIGSEVTTGAGLHDLVTLTDLTVAVKGTGPSRWITLTDTDLAADRLVWVDYTYRVLRGDEVEVLVVQDPSATWSRPLRLTRAQLAAQRPRTPAVWYDPSRGEAGPSGSIAVGLATPLLVGEGKRLRPRVPSAIHNPWPQDR